MTTRANISAWPDFEQAGALHQQAISLNLLRHADKPKALAALRALIDKGWSPYLHEYVGARMGRQTHHLFGKDASHSALFTEICEQFPATLQTWTLIAPIPGEKPAESRLYERSNTPWALLGPHQRAYLLCERSALLGVPANAGAETDAWLKCALEALMPAFVAFGGPEMPEAPFHGYFQCGHWSSLKAKTPDLAWMLSISLAAISMRATPSDAFEPWKKLAAAEATALPPASINATSLCARLLSASFGESLMVDQSEDFSLLAKALRADWDANEKAFFERKVAQGCGQLGPLIESDDFLTDHMSARKRAKPMSPADAVHLRALDARSLFRGDIGQAPMHVLCAVHGAQRCWDELQSISPAPSSLRTQALHRMRLPSPAEIARRLERHMAAAIAAGNGSAPMLQTNLEREATRGRRVLSGLPLPESLNLALHGPLTAPTGRGSDATLLAEGFSPEDKVAFERECAKAEAKVAKGRPASIAVPARFDWITLAICMGADPGFMLGKFKAGSLSRSCSGFEIHHPMGLHGRFKEAEVAAIEADEIAAATAPKQQPPSAEQAKRPRL